MVPGKESYVGVTTCMLFTSFMHPNVYNKWYINDYCKGKYPEIQWKFVTIIVKTSVHLVLLGVLKDNESLSGVPMDIDTWK